MSSGYPNTTQTFWERVDRTGDCWEWQGRRLAKGYGHFSWQGGVVVASRLSFELTHGPIPAGLRVLHRCDNPPCVRPSHLFLGTDRDNAADRDRKGRRAPPIGEKNGRARLTASQVAVIRERAASGRSTSALAIEFGVSVSTIKHIITGRTWAAAA